MAIDPTSLLLGIVCGFVLTLVVLSLTAKKEPQYTQPPIVRKQDDSEMPPMSKEKGKIHRKNKTGSTGSK